MATYIELQNRVSRNVIDLPASVSDAVPTLVKAAVRELQTKHNYKVMEALQEVSTTVDTRVLAAVPADFKEMREHPYIVFDRGTYAGLSYAADVDAARRRYDEVEAGEPRILFEGVPFDELGTRNWEVYPLPDGNSDYSDGEYRIKIPYWKYLTELNADADTNWFTVNGDKFIEFMATSEAFAIDWDETRMTMWLQRAQAEERKLQMIDKKYRLSMVDTLVPHYKGVHSNSLRRS